MRHEDGSETIDRNVIEWLGRQEGGFMALDVCYLTNDEAEAFVHREDRDDAAPAGFYWRLSAEGYLDATDWYGPYNTVADAVDEAYETFGDCPPAGGYA